MNTEHAVLLLTASSSIQSTLDISLPGPLFLNFAVHSSSYSGDNMHLIQLCKPHMHLSLPIHLDMAELECSWLLDLEGLLIDCWAGWMKPECWC